MTYLVNISVVGYNRALRSMPRVEIEPYNNTIFYTRKFEPSDIVKYPRLKLNLFDQHLTVFNDYCFIEV